MARKVSEFLGIECIRLQTESNSLCLPQFCLLPHIQRPPFRLVSAILSLFLFASEFIEFGVYYYDEKQNRNIWMEYIKRWLFRIQIYGERWEGDRNNTAKSVCVSSLDIQSLMGVCIHMFASVFGLNNFFHHLMANIRNVPPIPHPYTVHWLPWMSHISA